MIGLLILAGELFRGARPSRAWAKPSRFRELQHCVGIGDDDQALLSHEKSSRSRDAIANARDGRAPQSVGDAPDWAARRHDGNAVTAKSLNRSIVK
jgi:hypothetical protein